MRADARRNRDRVLAAAFELFAAEGLGVTVQQVARRAGVGTGTVSRHFPAKEDLYRAVFLSRVERLDTLARELADAPDAGAAFGTYLAELVAEGTANRGLAEALAGTGFDLTEGGDHAMTGLAALLRRAQESGELRPDIGLPEVKALVTGCLSAPPESRARMVDVVLAGLRT
jgi:AcrR family transcriptional regulator